MNYKKHFIISTMLLLLIQSPLSAKVYKWVDENGQVHYGERPGNTGAEQVKIRHNETTAHRPLKTAEGEEGAEDAEGAESEKENEKEKEKEKLAKEKPEKPQFSKKQKRQYCNEAKSDIATISSRGRMRERNAQGEYIYLTDKQREQRLSAARKKQKDFCR